MRVDRGYRQGENRMSPRYSRDAAATICLEAERVPQYGELHALNAVFRRESAGRYGLEKRLVVGFGLICTGARKAHKCAIR